MPFVGNQPAQSYSSFAKQDFTTSATTSYTLDYPVANENEVALFINFVRQEPTTAYTASGTSLTLTSATSASDDMYAIFLGKAVQTVNPPDGSVDSSKINYPLTTFSSTGIDDNATSTAITIDSSQNVGIGTTSPDNPLHVVGDSTFEHRTNVEFKIQDATDAGGGTRLSSIWKASGSDVEIGNIEIDLTDGTTGSEDSQILFKTIGNGTLSERMRIDSGGGIHGGINNPSTSPQFDYHNDSQDGNVARFHNNTTTRPYGIATIFGNASPDDNTRYAYFFTDSTAIRFAVYSDGDVKNHDNSYGALSDERIKQDIRDSNSQWNDIKNIRVRNFKKKDDVRQYGENAWEQIGVIAQELEQVSPKLIKHSDPTPSEILSDTSFGTLYQEGDEIPEGKNIGDVKEIHQQVKGVSYSVLYMKAIKALQEAMERIETLEAKVTQLENN
jgi:hypothetical protein